MDIQEVFVPEDVLDEARLATLELLPAKSKEKYERQLENFNNWRKSKNVYGINEDIMLAYFRGMDTHKASTTWSRFSMLKATLKVYENMDISRFKKLIAYQKGKSRIYAPKKAKALDKEHVERFLAEASDKQYLMKKVVLIMGISGACRCEELTKMCIDDIEDKGSYLLVTLPDTKTNKIRRFTVLADGYAVNVLDIYKKYASLRPNNCTHRRFFLNYKNLKCTVQPVGINTLSKVPRDIAIFLRLSDPDIYTGHSFRRSSATLLANGGGDGMALKRHGGWKSSTIAEGYVKHLVANKIEIAKKIMGGKTTSSSPDSIDNVGFIMKASTSNAFTEAVNCGQLGGINFHGAINNINFYINPGDGVVIKGSQEVENC